MAKADFRREKIIQYFEGKDSNEDASYIGEVFRDKENENELEHILRKQWYELQNENIGAGKDLNNILYRIHYEMNTREAELKKAWTLRNIIKWSARIAAIFILPLLVWSGIQFYVLSDKGKASWVEMNAPAWTRAHFSLPDGTTGWLNSSSSLIYRGDFIRNRNITLSGEAFFNVQKDPERPFVVITNEISVTAIGTRFNIASYENEKNIEVVLEEGKLIFNNKKMNKSYAMNPNDLVVYKKSLKDFSIEEVQPQKYLSWTEGKLVFRNDPLDVIARRMERWYNIEVEIQGSNTEDLRLRATFIDENLEEVLYFLKRSLPIDYRIEAGRMRDDGIYSKKKVIITHKIR